MASRSVAEQRELGLPPSEESIAGRGGAIRLFRFPVAEPVATILYLHGAQPLDQRACRRMSEIGNAQVVAVDCRQPPEHTFSAAVEDAVDAFAMLQLREKEWAVDPARIAVMGAGAGGALGSMVALHARDMCLTMPIAQLLIRPPAEMPASGPATARDWRESPLRTDTLAGLPPTFIAVDGPDPFRRQGAAFAQKLALAGVESRLRHVSGDAALNAALAFLGSVLAR